LVILNYTIFYKASAIYSEKVGSGRIADPYRIPSIECAIFLIISFEKIKNLYITGASNHTNWAIPKSQTSKKLNLIFMKKLITLSIVIFFIVTTSAQTPQLNWAKSFKGKGASTDSTSVMEMYTKDKSIYILGTSDTYGTANDIVLIKRDYVTGDTLWTRHYNGPASGDDQAVDMVINQSTGDVYLTGKCTGLSSGYDVITLKYSSAGELKWLQRWDNQDYHGDDIPKSIGIDFNGEVYVTGSTYNGSAYDEDIFILSLKSTGILNNIIDDIYTSYNYPLSHSKDLIGASKVSNAGDVFIGGDFMMGSTTNGWSAIFVMPYRNNYYGSLYSYSCIGMGNDYAAFPQGVHLYSPDDINQFQTMDLDNSNNIYLAYLNDTIQDKGNGYRICITKINKSGCMVWERTFGKNQNAINLGVKSIKVDLNGNVYVAAYEKNNSGNFDWSIIKYNSSGVFQWRAGKQGTGNGNDIANDIGFDSFQNPVVAGVTNNTGTNNDITFVKYNKATGAEMFSINYDSNNGDEKAYNIFVDASQNIIINGIVNTATQSQNMITLRYCNPLETPTISIIGNTIYSDASTGNQWYNENGAVNGATNQDFTPTKSGNYYVIISENGCTSSASNTLHFIPTSIYSTELSNSVKIYPNPINNELTIELEGNTIQANFVILNSLGQAIYNGAIVEKAVIQTSHFTPGVYLIKLKLEKTLEFKKFIKK
jgi:hypothetical protein